MKHIYKSPNFGENWFSFAELYKSFVNDFPNGSIFVEVGSWKGKSAAFLAVEIINSKKDIKLYCVDTWAGSEEHNDYDIITNNQLYNLFLENIKDLTSVIYPLKLKSVDASKLFEDNSIDVVFIDACHEYNCVKEDINSWYPKVKSGGIIAGHDYYITWPGVIQAVDEFFPNKTVLKSQDCWLFNKI